MSLVEEYSVKAAAGVALVAVLGLTGCANQKFAQNNTELGGIPVGRVVTQTANQNLKTFKEQSIKRPIQDATRFTACPTGAQLPPAESTGNIVDDFWNGVKRTFTPTTTLSIGDRGCTGEQGVLPAPGAQRPGPRPTR